MASKNSRAIRSFRKRFYLCAKSNDMNNLQPIIEQAWNNRALLQDETTIKAIRDVIELLDSGKLRVAEPVEGGWQVNE